MAGPDLSRVTLLRISVVDADNKLHASTDLDIGAGLRSKIGEAHHLIYDDLEGDVVDQWVYRVKRLSQLGW